VRKYIIQAKEIIVVHLDGVYLEVVVKRLPLLLKIRVVLDILYAGIDGVGTARQICTHNIKLTMKV
jgi:hypothetical protein